MHWRGRTTRSPNRWICACVLSTFLASTIFPGFPLTARAQEKTDEAIYSKWEEISSLRFNGEFDAAIAILNDIIAEYSNSEEILRRAYNNLVFTLIAKKDESAAEEQARRALERFPDLTADELTFTPRVNAMYDGLRKEMFGSLAIRKPEESRIFVDEEFKGNAPIVLQYVPVGQHALILTKSGYRDYAETIQVQPGENLNLSLSMSRDRDKKWWILRAGAVVAAGVLLAVGLSGGGDEGGGSTPTALAGPPPPPTN